MTYKPDQYWENRLAKRFSLSGVGHIAFSDFYNRWLYKAKRRTLDRTLRTHHLDPSGKVVCDIGCGTGFFVDFYTRRQAAHIVGVDITNTSIQRLKRKYPRYEFVTADISTSLPTEAAAHRPAIVNVFDVLYHIKDDQAFCNAIANIAAIADTSTFVFITDVFAEDNIDAAPHVQFRSRDTYRRELQKNQMVITAVYPLYRFLNRPVFSNRLKGRLNRICRWLDNALAPVYYLLDRFFVSPTRCNMMLIVAKKQTAEAG